MVTRDGKQLARENSVARQSAKPQAHHKVSPLRQRMIRDMELAGFTPGTQQTYIGAVVKLQDHYHARPDTLSEKQVQQYILWLRDQKTVAKGTFQTNWCGLKFFYYRTLGGVDWPMSYAALPDPISNSLVILCCPRTSGRFRISPGA